jgi:uncharacterized protein
VIRRLALSLPELRPGVQSVGASLGKSRMSDPVEQPLARLLAVSDERVVSLEHSRNRQQVGRLDAVVACGDLEPDYLSFLGDAFHAPLLLVRGNHDRGAAWVAGREHIPTPLDGRIEMVGGLAVIGLSWPGPAQGRPPRSEWAAWRQALAAYGRVMWRRQRPQIVLSHAPPLGYGDVPSDPYHAGFAAYRWLCRQLRPALWLHGHTPVAAEPDWRTELGPTILLNVTGAVLIELHAPGSRIERRDSTDEGSWLDQGAA